MTTVDEGPAIAFYQMAWSAFSDGDIDRLEALSVDYAPFPIGLSGWISRHWLTTAIETSNVASVAWVLSKEPDVNYVDDEGFTALMTALQMEVDCTLPIHERRTPDEATRLTIHITDLLMEAGMDINLRCGVDRGTALHCAAAWSSVGVVRHLLALGADPSIRDEDYLTSTPIATAKSLKRWAVHAVLCEAKGLNPSGMPKKS